MTQIRGFAQRTPCEAASLSRDRLRWIWARYQCVSLVCVRLVEGRLWLCGVACYALVAMKRTEVRGFRYLGPDPKSVSSLDGPITHSAKAEILDRHVSMIGRFVAHCDLTSNVGRA